MAILRDDFHQSYSMAIIQHLHCKIAQDIVTRYASTTGHHVIRRFGWDCHGLPVEYEIDKKLGELLKILAAVKYGVPHHVQ